MNLDLSLHKYFLTEAIYYYKNLLPKILETVVILKYNHTFNIYLFKWNGKTIKKCFIKTSYLDKTLILMIKKTINIDFQFKKYYQKFRGSDDKLKLKF